MGFRVLLIAVAGKEPATIFDEYAVVPTGQYESIPESPVDGVMLPSGAYLLYINDEVIPDHRVFARLSQNALLIACYANETIMNSLASSWVNGLEQWSVFHDAKQGVGHLETFDPPEADPGTGLRHTRRRRGNGSGIRCSHRIIRPARRDSLRSGNRRHGSEAVADSDPREGPRREPRCESTRPKEVVATRVT